MQYFMDTTETIADGVGFSHYGWLHIAWLSIFLILVIGNTIWYRHLSERGKGIWRWSVALLILADEVFKVVMLLLGGRYTWSYLPLHLCSINIFVVLIHAWKPSKLLSGFLYTVCIPGAMAALLFPSWTALPLGNFMHLHSFTIHIMLALYPIVLGINGELAPSLKQLYKYLLLLVGLAIPIYGVNLLLDTNFMFLMHVDKGNPLYVFEQLWGSHLYGFPVLLVAIMLVMYGPMEIFRWIKRKKKNM